MSSIGKYSYTAFVSLSVIYRKIFIYSLCFTECHLSENILIQPLFHWVSSIGKYSYTAFVSLSVIYRKIFIYSLCFTVIYRKIFIYSLCFTECHLSENILIQPLFQQRLMFPLCWMQHWSVLIVLHYHHCHIRSPLSYTSCGCVSRESFCHVPQCLCAYSPRPSIKCMWISSSPLCWSTLPWAACRWHTKPFATWPRCPTTRVVRHF